MTHPTPPRLAEALLESLGAHPEFRDDVIGDLAEELALRAQWDGTRAAHRWYWREALRVVPHLLGSWRSGLRFRDVTRLAGVVLTAYVFVAMIAATVLAILRGVVGASDFQSALYWLAQRQGLPVVINFALGSFVAVAGGYVAGWLHRRAPVVAGMALGAAWSLAGLAAVAVLGNTPLWYALVMPFVMVTATTTGGVLSGCVIPSERQPGARFPADEQ